MVAPFVCDASTFLWNALKEGKKILLEGQLGSLKDPDHGIYPMVTSSSTLAAYGAIGAGIPPYEIKKIVTVVKAYSSAVGAGAFVSEIFGDEADELQKTRRRRRRVRSHHRPSEKNGLVRLRCLQIRLPHAGNAQTWLSQYLDVLGYLDEIPVCVGYEIDGKGDHRFPDYSDCWRKQNRYSPRLPGWKCDIRGIKKYEDLPENCRKYIEFVEEQIGFPITMVSNGPGRDDIIYRNK